jgi:hypothetical protein
MQLHVNAATTIAKTRFIVNKENEEVNLKFFQSDCQNNGMT